METVPKQKSLRDEYNAKALKHQQEKEPIYRECPIRGQCFCSGVCREIVGWTPKAKTSIFDKP